jgi:hypothetical protein
MKLLHSSRLAGRAACTPVLKQQSAGEVLSLRRLGAKLVYRHE